MLNQGLNYQIVAHKIEQQASTQAVDLSIKLILPVDIIDKITNHSSHTPILLEENDSQQMSPTA
ncbi:MAG: hypothetical protein B6D76_08035 [gamma proteobacterium symbiont of Stewartia floridana]|nr:MAG: hypothetical protein B6D76_08035 [gamma proteobacterium symbiont of Stewartia floridana]RLW60029.1 MAG: hypothetical protein B6D75_08535 [gamma proteobacterium symbiont of Stewartia floridana]